METKNNKKIMKKLILILSMFLFFSTSCKKEVIKGCTDNNAINYVSNAEEDNGTCTYTKAVFYSRFQGYTLDYYSYEINNVELSINGEYIGLITYYYPNGISDYYAPGTIMHQMNGDKIYWTSKVNLIGHTPITFSGSITPSSSEFVKINVVR